MDENKFKKYVKYWHIFSYGLFSLLGKKMTLVEIYDLSQEWAERDGHGGSWLDVLDGMGWICSIIGLMILAGFLMK